MHARCVLHFTPTSASRLDAIEGLFSTVTRRRRRGAFAQRTQAANARDIREHNNTPATTVRTTKSSKPLVWTKAATILAKLAKSLYLPNDQID